MAGLDLSSLVPLVEGLILLDTIRFSTPAAGEPVFDPDTGLYTWPVGEVLYEGPGAVQPSSMLPMVTTAPLPSQPWVGETTSRYRAFTPLSAPVAERDTLVTVVAVHPGGDQSLLGRQWRTQDPSLAATLGVVRVTGLDQIQQTQET